MTNKFLGKYPAILNDFDRYIFFLETGFSKDQQNDPYWLIRYEYYRMYGYTEESLNDPYPAIRTLARRYFNKNKST
jgi:hypothetical protein